MRGNDTSDEILYKDIPGYPGYKAGTDGSIWTAWKRSWGNGRIGCFFEMTDCWKKMTINHNGKYPTIKLCKNGKVYNFSVHRLILFSFVGNPPENHVACHNNGVKNDCRLENLRWDSRKGNEADKVVHGTKQCGAKHYESKITEQDVRDIRKKRSEGITLKSIAKEYGIHLSAVHLIAKRKTWASVD